jgi:GNAT superfamily N-acetyltransferase
MTVYFYMPIKIFEIGAEKLSEYSQIPIQFEAQSILDVELIDGGLGGMKLTEKKAQPFIKDYDETETPLDWPKIFDARNWGFFLAGDDEQILGAAAVAFNTNGARMLEERSDLAVLWDIRVRPQVRKRGVGKKLFEHAAQWSRARGCHKLKIETLFIGIWAASWASFIVSVIWNFRTKLC